jgi:hypothetical protein
MQEGAREGGKDYRTVGVWYGCLSCGSSSTRPKTLPVPELQQGVLDAGAGYQLDQQDHDRQAILEDSRSATSS